MAKKIMNFKNVIGKSDRYSIRLPPHVLEFIENKMKNGRTLSARVEYLVDLGIEVYEIIDAIRVHKKMLKEEKV